MLLNSPVQNCRQLSQKMFGGGLPILSHHKIEKGKKEKHESTGITSSILVEYYVWLEI